MQNILKSSISLLVIAAMFFVGCNDDQTDSSSLIMSESSENITISNNGRNALVILQPTGSSEEIVITASREWDFIKDGDNTWCKIVRDGDKIIISSDEFPSLYDRQTLSRIKLSNGVSAIITINQKGAPAADVELDFEKIEFSETGGSQKIEVTANKEWVVSGHEKLDWVTVAVEEGSFTVTTTANNKTDDLNAVLKVIAGNAINTATANCEVILAKQTPAYINTNADMVPVSKKGGVIRFAVDCNRTWSVNTTDDWYTTTTEGNEIILNVTPTSKIETKTGEFTIKTSSGDDPHEKTITIKQFVNPMIFEHTALVNDATAVLPMFRNVNIHIEWGDGETESRSEIMNKQDLIHKYAAAGKYEVAVYGQAEALYYSTTYVNGEVAPLTALKQWGDLGLTNLSRAFSGTSITEVPAGYKDVMKNATDITHMFAGSTLSAIPSDFFEGCDNIISANGMFSNSKLASIPAELLDGLPILRTAVAMFSYTPITTIPLGLFKNKPELIGVNTIFKACTSLEAIPENIFAEAPKLVNVLGAFSECSSLESIPAGLFSTNSNITNMTMTFEKCTKLTSIPVSLFDNCKKAIYFGSTFLDCTSLVGESPFTTIDAVNYHLYERTAKQGFAPPTATWQCFKGCVGLTDYETIPATWK